MREGDKELKKALGPFCEKVVVVDEGVEDGRGELAVFEVDEKQGTIAQFNYKLSLEGSTIQCEQFFIHKPRGTSTHSLFA